MSGSNQEALARLRLTANAPVPLRPSPRQRLEQLARPIAKRPPPTSLIEHLYGELRIIAMAAPTPEGEARYQELLKQLRVLEAEDARRRRQQLATSGPLKLGEVDAAIREARETLARYDHAAPTDPAGDRTDP
jgi:hypothetical protein